MRGGRDPLTKLFMLNTNEKEMTEKEIKPSQILEQFSENSVHECSFKKNLEIFLHQTCFSPPILTWIEAIKQNFFTNFSVLIVYIVKNIYLSQSRQ